MRHNPLIEVLEQGNHERGRNRYGKTYHYTLASTKGEGDKWVLYGDLIAKINNLGYEVRAVRPSRDYDDAIDIVLSTPGDPETLDRYEEEVQRRYGNQ